MKFINREKELSLIVCVETGINLYEVVFMKVRDEKGENMLGISTHLPSSKRPE